MPFGLTSTGFRRKRYADVITSMETRARDLFGANVNLNTESPLGIFIRVIAWSIATVWSVAEDVYNSAFVDTAEGQNLDKVGLYIAITRRGAVAATGEVEFAGSDGTDIPAGFQLATTGGVEFTTDALVTVVSGAATVDVTAVDAGIEGNVPPGTITQIVSPTPGVTSVTNAAPMTGGRGEETDPEFRARYALSVAKGGASTLESIRAGLFSVDTVRAVRIYENNRAIYAAAEGAVDTASAVVTWVSGNKFRTIWTAGSTIVINSANYTIDAVSSSETLRVMTAAGTQTGVDFSFANDRPPKSFECYLLGGASSAVATSILDTFQSLIGRL